jgi:hypothetical protein
MSDSWPGTALWDGVKRAFRLIFAQSFSIILCFQGVAGTFPKSKKYLFMGKKERRRAWIGPPEHFLKAPILFPLL